MSESRLQRKLIAWWALIGSLSVLLFAGHAISDSEPANDTFYRYETSVLSGVYYLLLLGLVLWIAVGIDQRDAFALRRPQSWKRAALIAGGVLLAMWILAGTLEQILHAGEEQGLDPRRITTGDIPPFVLSVLAIAVLGPVVEELTFRGIGFHLLAQFGQWPAIIVTSLAFALSHGIPEGIPVFFVIGAALGFVRSRTASIYPAIAMHGFFNGFQAVLGALN